MTTSKTIDLFNLTTFDKASEAYRKQAWTEALEAGRNLLEREATARAEQQEADRKLSDLFWSVKRSKLGAFAIETDDDESKPTEAESFAAYWTETFGVTSGDAAYNAAKVRANDLAKLGKVRASVNKTDRPNMTIGLARKVITAAGGAKANPGTIKTAVKTAKARAKEASETLSGKHFADPAKQASKTEARETFVSPDAAVSALLEAETLSFKEASLADLREVVAVIEAYLIDNGLEVAA